LTYAPGPLEEQLAIGLEPPKSLILPPAAVKTAPKTSILPVDRQTVPTPVSLA